MTQNYGPLAWTPCFSPQNGQFQAQKNPDACAGAFEVPRTGLEPARPKAQPPEDCASTNFATRVGVKCPGRDSNPHALTDTWPSTMPVYQFQHLGSAGCLLRRYVTRLGLEPRTLSLKVRCSNQLSYEVELWVVRDSNPRPSRCKRDALNQLS